MSMCVSGGTSVDTDHNDDDDDKANVGYLGEKDYAKYFT